MLLGKMKKVIYWISPLILLIDYLLFNYVLSGSFIGNFLRGIWISPYAKFLPFSLISLFIVSFLLYKIIEKCSTGKKFVYFSLFQIVVLFVNFIIIFLTFAFSSCEGEGCMGLIAFPSYLIVYTFVFITLFTVAIFIFKRFNGNYKSSVWVLSTFIIAYLFSFLSFLFVNYELDFITYSLGILSIPVFLISLFSVFPAFYLGRKINNFFSLIISVILGALLVILFLVFGGPVSFVVGALLFSFLFLFFLFYFASLLNKGNFGLVLVLIIVSVLFIVGGSVADVYVSQIHISDNSFRDLGQCDKIVGDAQRDWCYSGLVKDGGEISGCDDIVDVHRKYACYRVVAKSAGDISICYIIPLTASKEVCLLEYAGLYQNESLCHVLTIEDYKQQCLIGICENNPYKDSCYYYNAIDREDKELCEKVGDIFEKEKCIEVVEGNSLLSN